MDIKKTLIKALALVRMGSLYSLGQSAPTSYSNRRDIQTSLLKKKRKFVLEFVMWNIIKISSDGQFILGQEQNESKCNH